LAGQTATVSFWARATYGTPKIGANLRQEFGSGGSGAVDVNGQSATLSTSWARYSFTFSVPSVSGKTIGTSSFLSQNIWFSAGSTQATQSGSVGLQSATFQVWGVQLEAGQTSTAFQTATGTIQGELAACQRYYYRVSGVDGHLVGIGQCFSTTGALAYIAYPVNMRVRPTALEQSGTANLYRVLNSSASGIACSAVPVFANGTVANAAVTFTVASGLVAGNAAFVAFNNVSEGFLGWSAEL